MSLLWGILIVWAVGAFAASAAPGEDQEEKAALGATITSIKNSKVALNVGLQHGAQVGQEFVVVREEAVIGRIRLTRVRERSSEGEIVDLGADQRIYLGDRAQSGGTLPEATSPPAPSPPTAPEPAPKAEKEETSAAPFPRSSLAGEEKPSEAAPLEATITQVKNRSVALSVGTQHGAQPGQEFVVLRNGDTVGRIRLTRVQERSSEGEIVEEAVEEGQGIYLGDRAQSTTAVAAPPKGEDGKWKMENGKSNLQSPTSNLGGGSGGGHPRPRPVRFQDVVSGEHLTYEILRGIAARGLLRGYTARDFAGESERLFTRLEIGQILAAAVTDLAENGAWRMENGDPVQSPISNFQSPVVRGSGSEGAWNAGSGWGLRTLLPWYRREVEAAGLDYNAAMQRVTAWLEDAAATEKRPWFYSGLGEGRLGLSSDAATDGRWVTSVGGSLNDHAGAWLTLTNEREDVGTRWRDRHTVNRLLVEVELSPKDRLTVGRDTMRWGPGYNGNLLLTENSVPFDHIRYERDDLKLFKRSFFFTQFFTTYREDGHRKWITGRRLATPLSSTTEISYSEALKMQSAHQVWPSLVYVPLHVVQEYPFDVFNELERQKRQSNLLASLEVNTRVDPTATAHFQWLLDDLTTDKPVPRKIGWQLGGHWWQEHPFPLRGEGAGEDTTRTDLRLEYTFVDRGVYEHRQPPAAWFHEDQVIGHRTGPDSQDLYLRLRHDLTPREDVTLVYNWGRHGRSLRPTEEAPNQAPERETLWSLAYGRDFTPSLSVGARYLHHRLGNVGQTRGVNRTEDRLFLEARYGF